jgi:tetratricopeptide (TPR) repeat protein
MRLAVLLLVIAGACAPGGPGAPPQGSPPSKPAAAAAPARSQPVPRLPDAPGLFAPAFTTAEPGAIDGRAMDDAATCENCHGDVVAAWRASAHAFASFNNPIYRVSVDGFRAAVGEQPSRFCAGCHDPALLVDGAIDKKVAPDDARAHVGVSCLLCHSVTAVTPDGNGSYSLRTDPVPMPVAGDAQSLDAHIARLVSPVLRTPELCAGCHRAFLGVPTGQGHHLPGADDYGPWLRSSFAGSDLDRIEPEPLERRECRSCHMPAERAERGDVAADDGRDAATGEATKIVQSHRFAGGHSWLAAMRGDDAQLAAVQRMLRGAASIDVAAVRHRGGRRDEPAEAAALVAGEKIDIEVVVANERVGHHFPGGTRDMHDTFVELVVTDARGQRLGTAGVEHAASVADEGADVHVLRAVLLDESGRPVLARHVEKFRAPAYDATIAPRDAIVVPYELRLPRVIEGRLPLTVRARLVHRAREAALQDEACRISKTPEGQKWSRALASRGLPALDPCAPQPLTVVAETTVELGGPPKPLEAGDLALAMRLLRLGRAWQHALVEQIDEARSSLTMVRQLLDGDPRPRAARLRAAAGLELAQVAARQGRIDEMETWLAAASAEAAGEPSIAWVRGRALTSVWRHDGAVPWLEQAAAAAPRDDRAHAELAVALGSLGRDADALAAVLPGLALAPRHPDLLRVQALAMRALSPADPLTEPAFAAFLEHRPRDDGPRMRSKCALEVPGCARERTPAHHHLLLDEPSGEERRRQ